MTEKNGNFFNFDPSKYSYNPATDTITSTGLIVAGNSPHATPGVSNSTLTGRQWGFAPRIGIAWSPKIFDSKVVVRAGWGMYYDRGELYSYLSPPDAQSIAPGGPFGVNQQLPFVGAQFCPTAFPGTFQTCITTLSDPWGTTLAAPPNGNPQSITVPDPATGVAAMPNAAGIENGDDTVLSGGLRAQQQASLHHEHHSRHSMAAAQRPGDRYRRSECPGPARNHSRPVQPGKNCDPDQPLVRSRTGLREPGRFSTRAILYIRIHGSDGHGCGFLGCTLNLPNGQPMQFNSEGGNIDERVPYIGYAGESEEYTAAGISAYNALQTHVEKKLSHGLAGWLLLHLFAIARRAKRYGSLLQWQQPAGFARRLWPVGLRPHARFQHRLPLRIAQILLGVLGGRER